MVPFSAIPEDEKKTVSGTNFDHAGLVARLIAIFPAERHTGLTQRGLHQRREGLFRPDIIGQDQHAPLAVFQAYQGIAG